MNDQRLCIVGLGLMGGSLAHALKGKVRKIIAVDRHAATRQQALSDGVVDVATESLAAGVVEADFVILATPVRTILDTIQELPSLKPAGCIVLDLGSTKQAINEALSGLPASFATLGGHPMCGKEMAGYHAADPLLFQGNTFILTRNERTTAEVEMLVLELIDGLGATPLFLSAERHDRLTAAVSHLPYLLSATLMQTVTDQKDEHLWPTSASGFRDVSRLAGSDPQMLLDILLTNKTAVLEQLDLFRKQLDAVSDLLAADSEEALAAWLNVAQRQHITYRQQKTESDKKA